LPDLRQDGVLPRPPDVARLREGRDNIRTGGVADARCILLGAGWRRRAAVVVEERQSVLVDACDVFEVS
jgi:hypothetical protein